MQLKPRRAECESCPLATDGCPSVERYVPSESYSAAEFLIIGDHPSDYEYKAGRPFTGPAGNILMSALFQCDVSRGQADWTTTVLCKPPSGMTMARFLTDIRKKNKLITAENRTRKKNGLDLIALVRTPHQCCAPRLEEEISKHRNFILCGNFAISAMMEKAASLSDLRGSPLQIERNEKPIQVMVTYHPGYVQANLRFKAVMESDVRKGVEWFRSGHLDWKPPHTIYNPSAADLKTFLSQDAPYWTYDVETDARECLTANLRCIAIGTPSGVAVVGIRGIVPTVSFYPPDELEKVIAVMKEFFEDPTKVKCGHNAGYYDYHVMRHQLGINVTPLIDTILIHRLVNSELPHGLGFVATMYTNAPNWKTDRKGRKLSTGSESDHELHQYCAYDTAITAAILPPMMREMKMRKQEKLVECDHALQRVCADMHEVGMYVDQERRLYYEKKVLRDISERRETIRSISGLENLNPASTMQMRDLFFTQWRLDPPCDEKVRFTKNGDPSTSDAVLRSMLTIRSLTPLQREIITQIRHYRKSQKIIGTYITKLRFSTEEAWGGWDDDDSWLEKEWRDRYGLKKLGITNPETGRMHPGYNAQVTTSGRLSSSKPINAQNFPSKLRSMVCAQPGNILVGADADQLELRIAASRWKSQTYLQAFEDGLDPHSSVTAYAIFGDRFVQAAKECGAGSYPWKTGTKFSGQAKTLRNLAKTVQYASQFKGSVETVHRVITQTEVENEDGTTSLPYLRMGLKEVRVMHKKWCEGAQFEYGWKSEIESWRERGFLQETVMGRRRYFEDGENPNELVNFPIQAAGASLMNIAIIDLHQRIPIYKWGPGTGIINQCHDAIIVECPIAEAEWVKEQIEDAMNLTHDSLPGVVFTAEGDIAHRWSDV